MNTFGKTTLLTLIHLKSSPGSQVSKMGLYRLFRCLGKRLYSTGTCTKPDSGSLMSTSNTNFTQTQSFSTTDVNHGVKNKLTEMSDKVIDVFARALSRNQLTSKPLLKLNSVRLYLSCAGAVVYNKIQDHVTLPNTFSTWHKLVALHMWIIMTRLVKEDKPGNLCKKYLIGAFHEDVEQKVKDIGNKMEIRVQTQEVDQLHQQFVASLMAYDEGLLHGDRYLAGALWRMLFMQAEDVDPCDLETMVHYVRKNVKLIHSLEQQHILCNGMVPFLPVKGDTIPKESYDVLREVAGMDLK